MSDEALREASGGSSPLARGLLLAGQRRRERRGIIPARAGFTHRGRRRSGRTGDHPRSRGVYALNGDSQARETGSSPLARGLRRPASPASGPTGIIPARAGFTPGPRGQRGAAPDHPRSRGVYQARRPVRGHRLGSSPLARGLRPGWGLPRPGYRIIPARAGFTAIHSLQTFRRRDHPRSRGVYGGTDSSLDPGDGIIPARAGFTL